MSQPDTASDRTIPNERVVVLFYSMSDDLFLVEHTMDKVAGFRRWGFPSDDRRPNDAGVTEVPMAAVRRIAQEWFGHEMDVADHMRCYDLLDAHSVDHGRIVYEPFIVFVDDRTMLAPQPGITAEWKTFAQIVLLGERGFFPEVHIRFLNAAKEFIRERGSPEDPDEDDPDSFSEDD